MSVDTDYPRPLDHGLRRQMTARAHGVVVQANRLAHHHGHAAVSTMDLLEALALGNQSVAHAVLSRYGLTEPLRSRSEGFREHYNRIGLPRELPWEMESCVVARCAADFSERNRNRIGPEHLLHGLAVVRCEARRLLIKRMGSPEAIERAILEAEGIDTNSDAEYAQLRHAITGILANPGHDDVTAVRLVAATLRAHNVPGDGPRYTPVDVIDPVPE